MQANDAVLAQLSAVSKRYRKVPALDGGNASRRIGRRGSRSWL